MRPRRVVALLLALPLLQLNAARAALACDRHDDAHTPPASTSATSHEAHKTHAAGHEHGEGPASGHELPQHGQGDEKTGVVECCQALTSCSLAFGVADAQSFARAPVAHAGVPIRAADGLLSRVSAPEPPPPKA